jgi:hypothetical protein
VNAPCIWPPNEVLRVHVGTFHHSPSTYDWRKVYVRAHECERAFSSRTLPLHISDEQRTVHFALEKQFQGVWKTLRPKLEEIIKRNPNQRLRTFDEAAEACVKPGGVLWGFAVGLYTHAFEMSERPQINDEEIKPFMEACPPFRAACYSFVKAWFNYSLSPTHFNIPKAGRNDLMMATYLPYANIFLTNPYGQRLDLADIARVAQIPCDVTAFEQFSDSFNVNH